MAETPIDPRGRLAPYEQVAQRISGEIDAGKYGEDGPLPSEPDLAKRFGVARDTVRRALELLRTQGRIETLRGRGSFVVPREAGPEND
ncbi:GntR family transcriptional regulator [Kitasatospora sp. NPDC004272]